MLLDHCNPTLSLRTLSTAAILLALVEDQKAFGKRAVTHVILMVREEANLLHERSPQLALAEEGMGQVGVSSSMVGYGRGGMEEHSEGCSVSPGGMLCLVPAGDRPAKAVSTDLRLLFSLQPLGFRVKTFCN